MGIPVKCECGEELVAPDSEAGKRIKCPGCTLLIDVPTEAPKPKKKKEKVKDKESEKAKDKTKTKSAKTEGAKDKKKDVSSVDDIDDLQMHINPGEAQRDRQRKVREKELEKTAQYGSIMMWVGFSMALTAGAATFYGYYLARPSYIEWKALWLIPIGVVLAWKGYRYSVD